MGKLLSTRKRLTAVGLVSAFVVALAVVGGLWAANQTASAGTVTVGLVHLNPDGTVFPGNPYCPDTTWSATGAKPTFIEPRHDCTNLVGQDHIVRTNTPGLVTPEVYPPGGGFKIDGVGIIVTQGPCSQVLCSGPLPLWCDDDGDGLVDEDGDNEDVDDDGDYVDPVDEPETTCDGVDDDDDQVVDDGACMDEDPTKDGVDQDDDSTEICEKVDPGAGNCDDKSDNDLDGTDMNDPSCANGDGEDPGGDANGDGCPGLCDEDDDGDTLVDEDSAGNEPTDPAYLNDRDQDDDEDNLVDEDPFQDGTDEDDDANEDGTLADPGYGNCDDESDNDSDGTDFMDSCCQDLDGEDPIDFDDDDDGTADEDPPGNNDPDLADEYCAIIRSSKPGETNVTFVYPGGSAVVHKEWDKLMDTAILKVADIEKVTVPGIGSVELPKDANGNGERDAEDAHLMDHDGETQNHAVAWDEARKRDKSAEGPIRLIDVAHGQHPDCPGECECPGDDPRCACPDDDPWCWEGDHPTQGAVMMAFIESPKGCTYFTNPTTIDIDEDGVPDYQPGEVDFGDAMVGRSDWRGFFIGPRSLPASAQLTKEATDELAAHLLSPPMSNNSSRWWWDFPLAFWNDSWTGVYVDTTCEEQAKIIFKVGYPGLVQSDPPFPEIEEVTINWTTVEPSKQPQIRWAGEKIVLEKRWAAPGEWYPEAGGIDNDGDGSINEDTGNVATDDEDGDGLVDEDGVTGEGGMTTGFDDDGDQHEDGTRGDPGDDECTDGDDNDGDTKIDNLDTNCKSGAGIDEDVMDDDDDGLINEDPLDFCPYVGWPVKYIKLDGPGGLVEGLPVYPGVTPYASEPEAVWTYVLEDCTSAALYTSEDQGQVNVDAELYYPGFIGGIANEHAFLVWFLKIYELKLTNVPGARAEHNDGAFTEAEGADLLDPSVGDVTEETVNVSADALLRVRVKGYFYGGNNSWHPDVCIDINGDGDGDDATTDDVPGEPYPTITHEGCAYPDHILAAGYWVLPDDLPELAGPDPDRLADYDVMSEPDVAATSLIGPKSTLDSHDDKVRNVVPCVQPKKVKVGDVYIIIPNWDCTRKTLDPDGAITEADAIMPPLKILVALDDTDAGFLKAADKGDDVGISSAYQSVMIPADDDIPQPANNCRYDWDSWGFSTAPQYDYKFYDILTKTETADGLIRDFRFYTDNRGEGFFFVNGDYNLTYDECDTDPLTKTPDCHSGDLVGTSEITVIGDYPYCRKHTAVESNVVTKNWEWGGDKWVDVEPLDPNHTRIIAHVLDRDGYCKWDPGVNTAATPMAVQFSPSLNPVEGEEITFEIVNGIGHILGPDLDGLSPNALFSVTPTPLGKATVKGWEDGVWINSEKAVVKAEHAGLLDAIGKAGRELLSSDTVTECQAWVIIEHPLGAELEVSVSFDDPEGRIARHWPPDDWTVFLQTGWNDSCYVGPERAVEDALEEANLLEDVIAIYRLDPTDTADPWDGYFPGSPDASDLETLMPYDQLFILTAASGSWVQPITVGTLANGKDEQVDLVLGWNSVCYAGSPKVTEQAVSPIAGDFSIMYNLSGSGWLRYVPGRPEVPDTLTSLDRFMSVFLLVTATEGTTWAFDP